MSDTETPSKKINANKYAKVAPRAVVVSEAEHRHQRFENGQEPAFDAGCRACVKADRERKPVPEAELATTVFLYPRDGHTQQLCKTYLEARYPGFDLEHGSELPIWQLVSADIQIVCVRPLADAGKALLTREVTTLDAWGKPQQTPRPESELLTQVCESAPLKTSELCHLSGGTAGKIAVSGRWEASALINAIHENFPGYRVQVPDQKNNTETLSAWPV